MTGKILGPMHAKWFDKKRGIDAETVVKFGIYTDEADSNVLVFPYWERGVAVNEKYRGPDKKFWQRPGGRRTFWNSDVLDDPLFEAGHMALVITEGEIDALTAIDCGFPLTVSVPDGAPPVPEGKAPDELEPLDKTKEGGTGKFEFLWNNRDRLKGAKRFVIAVDNDPPGQRLAAELVRRLSASRCMFVTYPDGCKDLNDVLVKWGRDEVARCLNTARPYPVRGLYRLSDYPEVEPLRTYSLGWDTLDQHCQMFAGEFMVVTGIPQHGKSTLVLNMVANLADRYGWRTVLFSPEMPTMPLLRDKLRRIHLRRKVLDLDVTALRQADEWINRTLVFIDSDPTGRVDEDFDLDWILDRATDAVLRDGVSLLVIDPWNEIEHAKKSSESMTDYIGRSIRSIKRFARLYNVAVIVIAHPTKDVVDKGKIRPVTLYDVEGSAHWFNKCDHGVIVDRDDETGQTRVRIAKVRFTPDTGERGSVRLAFDRYSDRFEMLEPDQELVP